MFRCLLHDVMMVVVKKDFKGVNELLVHRKSFLGIKENAY